MCKAYDLNNLYVVNDYSRALNPYSQTKSIFKNFN